MGYVNLSYYIRERPEKISGPKSIFGSGPDAVKAGPMENLRFLNSHFFNFQLDL